MSHPEISGLNNREALAELSLRCGIVPEYYDIWGSRHVTAAHTQAALLGTMGIATDSDEAVAHSLRARAPGRHDASASEQTVRRLAFEHVLAPVQVVREDEAPCIVVALPADREQVPVRWTLREEGGDIQSGEWRACDLKRLDEREVEGSPRVCRQFQLPRTLAPGYHELTLEGADDTGIRACMSLIVTPGRCYSPPAFDSGRRVWGVALQLYSLRSQRNWGIGDFGDLTTVIELAGELGAATVGLNPLHALYPSAPERTSPYSPSSRLFLNPLYVHVERVADFAECEPARAAVRDVAFQARLDVLRQAELVDYRSVAAAKFQILRLLYEHFHNAHQQERTGYSAQFERFLGEGGEALALHTCFEALQSHFGAHGEDAAHWCAWPEPYRDPASAEVQTFVREHAHEIGFYQYLQWQAALQLAAAAQLAAERGLSLGLYRDMALGSDGQGAEQWAGQSLYARGTYIGAPPDDFSPNGQNWGLPPLLPDRLWTSGFRAFIAALRANMQADGALRIDHVMSLSRLFWVPPGHQPVEGAYVLYPFDELLGIVALESQRNRCLVIGEDLGTVSNEVRAALHDYGVLSYRVLYFEKHWDGDGAFKQPWEYPQAALATASTHDLPTLAGFWIGRDLQTRRDLNLFADPQMYEHQRLARTQDRVRLRDALAQAELGVADDGDTQAPAGLTESVHRYLARSPASVLMVQIEDVLELVEQANVPGTTTEHPNWRRKLPLDLEDWRQRSNLSALAEALNADRG